MDEKLAQFEANFSVLDRYGVKITDEEYITNPAIGRDQQIKELILILLTPEKSAILIGKPGIGKTAIVEGLAYRMQRNEVPDALKGYTIINLKTASLLGTMPSGESKVQKMIDELKTRDKVILFIDEIHMLIGATDSSSLDFANIFKEGLGRGSIKVIGATTTEEYERYILRDKAFTRRFQKVEVPEPTREETIQIMMGTLPKFEKQTGRKMKYTPFIQERIMSFIVDITSEYKRVFALGSRYPDVCLTLLKQAFSYTVYDNREYMDIFDIRKAIENSKNIYPDVIKKELPNFDKMFNDIILEEKGEKPIEEWRKDTSPIRREVDENYSSNNSNSTPQNSNRYDILSDFNSDTSGDSGNRRNSNDENLQKLEDIPDMVDGAELKNRKPVQKILSGKSMKKFAKIGPASISNSFKDNFNSKSDAGNLDELLLSGDIGVIKEKDTNSYMPTSYSVTDELKPNGTNDILLGSPIQSTIKYNNDEEIPEQEAYKSDNRYSKDIDPNNRSLIINNDYVKENSEDGEFGKKELIDNFLLSGRSNQAISSDEDNIRYMEEYKNGNVQKPKKTDLVELNPNFEKSESLFYNDQNNQIPVEQVNSDEMAESVKPVEPEVKEPISYQSEEKQKDENKAKDNYDFIQKYLKPWEGGNSTDSINENSNSNSNYYQNQVGNVEGENSTDIFGQLLVPHSDMRIKDGQIIDDFSTLDKSLPNNNPKSNIENTDFVQKYLKPRDASGSIKEEDVNSEPVMNETGGKQSFIDFGSSTSNENKIGDTFNLNNKTFEKYLENTTEPVEPVQNDEFISDRPDIPGRKWKFLGDYVDTSIEDRPVESTRDISKDRNLYSDYEQEKLQNLPSSEFINFNDLKSGKLDDKETSKFIMQTGNENKNMSTNMNINNNVSNQFLEVPTKREISPSNTPVIDTNNNVTNISNIANSASNNNDNYANNMMINNIKLDENVSDNDNFFDDFYDE